VVAAESSLSPAARHQRGVSARDDEVRDLAGEKAWYSLPRSTVTNGRWATALEGSLINWALRKATGSGHLEM
jgi:hypothetical protein